MDKSHSVILFDGYCNLCSSVVDFLQKHVRRNQYLFIPLQSEKGIELRKKYGLHPSIDSVILIIGEKVFIESDAVLEIARTLSYPWKILMVFGVIPRFLRNKIYRFLASVRYRLWGRRLNCKVL
jgi:predicted DCC family thiol-disulfide oxidoreductase YuxK